jgi:hypothetical protein
VQDPSRRGAAEDHAAELDSPVLQRHHLQSGLWGQIIEMDRRVLIGTGQSVGESAVRRHLDILPRQTQLVDALLAEDMRVVPPYDVHIGAQALLQQRAAVGHVRDLNKFAVGHHPDGLPGIAQRSILLRVDSLDLGFTVDDLEILVGPYLYERIMHERIMHERIIRG